MTFINSLGLFVFGVTPVGNSRLPAFLNSLRFKNMKTLIGILFFIFIGCHSKKSDPFPAINPFIGTWDENTVSLNNCTLPQYNGTTLNLSGTNQYFSDFTMVESSLHKSSTYSFNTSDSTITFTPLSPSTGSPYSYKYFFIGDVLYLLSKHITLASPYNCSCNATTKYTLQAP